MPSHAVLALDGKYILRFLRSPEFLANWLWIWGFPLSPQIWWFTRITDRTLESSMLTMKVLSQKMQIRSSQSKRPKGQDLRGLPVHGFCVPSQGIRMSHPLGPSICSQARKPNPVSVPEFLLGFYDKGMMDWIIGQMIEFSHQPLPSLPRTLGGWADIMYFKAPTLWRHGWFSGVGSPHLETRGPPWVTEVG